MSDGQFEVFVEVQWGEFTQKKTKMVDSWEEALPLIRETSSEAYGEYMHNQRQRDYFLRLLSGE